MAKKRKAGDGLIRQRADGRWEGRYVVGYDDHGYPKTKAVFGKSKRECAEKLAALKTQLGGIPSDKLRPEMRFADWLDYWYETHCKPNIRTSTQSGYEDRIRLHIKPELGEIPLNRLTQNDLQQFYARLKKSGRKTRTEYYGEGLSDRMVRMCHATCRSALQRAVQDGLIRTNPAEGCKLPPKKAREMQVLARDELQRFLIQAQAEGYYELFLLDLATGLRRGELLALQWDDLDFETGVLTISKQVSLVRGKIVMSVPKTKSSIRKPRLRQPCKIARHFLDVRISIHLRHERDAAQDVIHEMRVDLTLQESKLAVHGDELFLINVVDQMVDRVRHGVERLTHGGKFLTIVLRELDAEILLRDLLELERHLLKRPQPPHHSEEHDRCDGKQKQNAGDHIRRGDLI
mgnify:CR=1 FL=1